MGKKQGTGLSPNHIQGSMESALNKFINMGMLKQRLTYPSGSLELSLLLK
jgi:hypothetical protein